MQSSQSTRLHFLTLSQTTKLPQDQQYGILARQTRRIKKRRVDDSALLKVERGCNALLFDAFEETSCLISYPVEEIIKCSLKVKRVSRL